MQTKNPKLLTQGDALFAHGKVKEGLTQKERIKNKTKRKKERMIEKITTMKKDRDKGEEQFIHSQYYTLMRINESLFQMTCTTVSSFKFYKMSRGSGHTLLIG
jgi:hypothetical protein